MESQIQIKAYTKSQLAEKYGVHYTTLKRWLSTVPGLNLIPGQRILTPAQVELVLRHLGPA